MALADTKETPTIPLHFNYWERVFRPKLHLESDSWPERKPDAGKVGHGKFHLSNNKVRRYHPDESVLNGGN